MLESLKRTSIPPFRWFENNLLKSSADKCHFLVSTSQKVSLNVNNIKAINSDCKKRLGVEFDSKPRFDQHITNFVEKLVKKTRTSEIWISQSRENKSKTNQLYGSCLRTMINGDNDKQ